MPAAIEIPHTGDRVPVPHAKRDGSQEEFDIRKPPVMNIVDGEGEHGGPTLLDQVTPQQYASKQSVPETKGPRKQQQPQKQTRYSRPAVPPKEAKVPSSNPLAELGEPPREEPPTPTTRYNDTPDHNIDRVLGTIADNFGAMCQKLDTLISDRSEPEDVNGYDEPIVENIHPERFAKEPEEEVTFHLHHFIQTSRFHNVIVTPELVVLAYDTAYKSGDKITLLPTGDNPIGVVARGKTYNVGYMQGMRFMDGDMEYTVLVKVVD